MTPTDNKQDRTLLQRIAHQAMIDKRLIPDFPPEALAELGRIQGPASATNGSVHDQRNMLWCSIDNDDSRDLDQLTVAEALPGGAARILVAVADVDAVVKKGTALDTHAWQNTTSVYTAAQVFPMLPEKLSTDLTSLNFASDRLAVVMDMTVDASGALKDSSVYTATVRNQAKLAYNSTAAWLDGTGPIPPEIAAVKGLDENIRLQDSVAQKLQILRHQQGALELETIEAHAVFQDDTVTDLKADTMNRAKEIIQDFMIAANGVTARYLAAAKVASLRRVVRVPKRWDAIVALAAQHGTKLPSNPDPVALAKFLAVAKAADPLRFPDLSTSIVKLLGPGEYIVQLPGATVTGHFGLAVKDYTHSTAPNRRFPDLVTHRLLKAVLAGSASPYSTAELTDIAQHCTQEEDAAKKVERQVTKAAGAIMLQSRIGAQFDGVITGASEKGVYVRLLQPAVEGRITIGFEGLDVGKKVRVQLVHTNVEHGFIDFKKIG
jgi:ribonuclease R